MFAPFLFHIAIQYLKNKIMDSSNNLPKSIVDKIILQAEIDFLLNKTSEKREDLDAHSLTPVQQFYESKFNRGTKESRSASKPLRKAYKSMFVAEVNMLGMKGNCMDGLILSNEPYVKVLLPGEAGEFYVETGRLKQLLKEFSIDEYTVSYDDGLAVVKLFCIDKQLLLDNCEVR